MELAADVREAILVLVEASKKFQVKALSQNAALAALLSYDPKKRADLTPGQINDLVAAATPRSRSLVDEVAAPLEKALAEDKDVLDWLRAYSSRILDLR